MKKVLTSLVVFLLIFQSVQAATSPWLVATGDINAWDDFSVFPGYPDKYRAVDESVCNGDTDGVWAANDDVYTKQAFSVDISSVPIGSTITGVTVRPCLGIIGNAFGSGSSTAAIRINLDGITSSRTFYNPFNVVPDVKADAVYTGLSITKATTTELLVGFEYFFGEGLKVSHFEVQLDY